MSKSVVPASNLKLTQNKYYNHNLFYILLALCVAVLAYAISMYSTDNAQYIVYIDAGSSGTRIHIHNYAINSNNDLPHIIASHAYKLKPGLHTLIHNNTAIQQQITELVQYAVSIIPQQYYDSTVLYFGATAGLRTLTKIEQNEILHIVTDVLSHCPFVFDTNNVELISGQDEGINAWIATNYLLGSLTNDTHNTTGVIELGGASLQLTYAITDTIQNTDTDCNVPNNEQNSNELHDTADIHVKQHYIDSNEHDDVVTLTLGTQQYTIYTRSYLNYGLERAQQMIALHMQSQLTDKHPCYVRHSPFELLQPILSTLKPINAQGNYTECVKLVQELFDYTQSDICTADVTHCQLEPLNIPSINSNQSFVAIENFFYTSEFLHVQHYSNWLSLLQQHGNTFCTVNWNELIQQYPNEPANDLVKYCFSTSYIPYLLKHGLQLDLSYTRTIRHINGNSIDWCLGDVIRKIMLQQQNESYIVHALLACVTAVVAFWMILRALLLTSNGAVSPIQYIQQNGIVPNGVNGKHT